MINNNCCCSPCSLAVNLSCYAIDSFKVALGCQNRIHNGPLQIRPASNFCDRFTYLFVGAAFILPVINLISYAVYHIFAVAATENKNTVIRKPYALNITTRKTTNEEKQSKIEVDTIIEKYPNKLEERISQLERIRSGWIDNGWIYDYFDYLLLDTEFIYTRDGKDIGTSSMPYSDTGRYIELTIAEYNPKLDLPLAVLMETSRHWVLVFIDPKKETVEYYDSLKNYGAYEEITASLKDLSHKLSKQYNKNYQFVEKIHEPVQTNLNCGIWVCYFLKNRLNNPDVDFNKTKVSITDFRDQEMLKVGLVMQERQAAIGFIAACGESYKNHPSRDRVIENRKQKLLEVHIGDETDVTKMTDRWQSLLKE